MDFHGYNQHYESGKMEQIVSQFLLKALHIILDSRIPSLRPNDRRIGDVSLVSRAKKSDKWFNLALGDRPLALENLNFWHRNWMDPMIIDIILVHGGLNSSSTSNLSAVLRPGLGATPVETIIERWVVQYESPRFMSAQHGEGSSSYKRTYKKSIILFRSLYSTMRLLPAYRIFRQLSSSSQSFDFDIIYKVSSFTIPFTGPEVEIMKQYSFLPVEALPGRLNVTVTYRPSLSEFNLTHSVSLAPQIIADYVGSPTTDPMRAFRPRDKRAQPTSLPFRGHRSPSSAPFQRPHSWTSGLHKAAPYAQNQFISGSPPVYNTSSMPFDFSSSPPDISGNRFQFYGPTHHKRATSFDEYQLSPPFSPSPSPSPPTYFLGSSPMQNRFCPETAPVSIPLPIMGRSPSYRSPNFSDPNRQSLPPMSPRSVRPDSSSQESPSAVRSFRKSEALRAAELYSGLTTHNLGQKVTKDGKDDSGRFSGLLSSSCSPRYGFSRSSSRLSFQDELDDYDFSCPFVVDDVDMSEPPSRHADDRKASNSSSQAFSMSRKSQDAAVGALVHMLRTAPPLRQDSSFSSQSLKNDGEGETGAVSGYFMSRKASDALHELEVYKEMKELLLSKSGSQITSKEAS
ncbi:Autophagy-related protein 13, N-terminal [Dillenia turbinata]|uniref:Autophagy-related protein 13, N-terminal n=1 Tax=Dillenia turbinata TaxID=194707 RepID=A0AAN8ZG82_9MAGN